jgi:hypothetical protein
MPTSLKTVFLLRCKRGPGFYNLHMDQNVVTGVSGPYPSRPIARIEAMKQQFIQEEDAA